MTDTPTPSQSTPDENAPDDAELTATVTQIMRDNPICMATTISDDGSLTSRPMTIQHVEPHGDVWFFALAGSDLANQVEADDRINLAFEADRAWLSLAGNATLEVDQVRTRDWWNEVESAWFDGPEDPNLRLLHVAADSAQLWESPGMIGMAVAMAKAIVTDDDAEGFGETREVEL